MAPYSSPQALRKATDNLIKLFFQPLPPRCSSANPRPNQEPRRVDDLAAAISTEMGAPIDMARSSQAPCLPVAIASEMAKSIKVGTAHEPGKHIRLVAGGPGLPLGFNRGFNRGFYARPMLDFV